MPNEVSVGDLIARYNMSGPQAKVWVTETGEGRAVGGDPDLLAAIRARRDEVVAYLTTPCSHCGDEVATRLAWTPDGHLRIGEACWRDAVRLELARPGGAVEMLTAAPKLVAA